MAARTKLTPFARFLLFLIILLPLAYFGAAYYRGEDPVAKFKSVLGQESKAESSAGTSHKAYDLQDRVQELEKENANLRAELKTLKAELEQIRTNSTSREKWGN
ncbi:MAG: hypothetical protein D6772_01650 [Bacteroidetes bacterium]|nr:MAG: hypothetical protein D6772_01650 [Bacteroidota bacterium]